MVSFCVETVVLVLSAAKTAPEALFLMRAAIPMCPVPSTILAVMCVRSALLGTRSSNVLYSRVTTVSFVSYRFVYSLLSSMAFAMFSILDSSAFSRFW